MTHDLPILDPPWRWPLTKAEFWCEDHSLEEKLTRKFSGKMDLIMSTSASPTGPDYAVHFDSIKHLSTKASAHYVRPYGFLKTGKKCDCRFQKGFICMTLLSQTCNIVCLETIANSSNSKFWVSLMTNVPFKCYLNINRGSEIESLPMR